MGEVKKINDEYYIEFFARGLKYQQKAGSDRVKAEALLATIEDKIAKGEAAMIVRDVDIDIFFLDFDEYGAKTYTPKTFKRYQSTAKHFFSFLRTQLPALIKLSQVTPNVIEQYKGYLQKISDPKQKKRTPKTVNLTLILLKDILEYARKLGYLNDNPAIHTPLVKIKHHQKKLFGEEDLHKILHAIPEGIAFAIETILNSGITAQELVNLKWEDVSWERRTVKITGGTGNGFVRLPRTIPVHPKYFELLTMLKKKNGGKNSFLFFNQSGQPLTEEQLASELQEIAKINHLEGILNFTSLVKAFSRSLITRGVPIATLQKILGHDDVLKTLLCSRLLMGQSDHVV